MQAFPKWRDNPKFVFLNVEIIGRDDWSKPVVYAKLEVKGEVYVVTVEEDLMDTDTHKMPDLIIADVGENDYLVDLPGESLSAGSRLLVGVSDVIEMSGQ